MRNILMIIATMVLVGVRPPALGQSTERPLLTYEEVALLYQEATNTSYTGYAYSLAMEGGMLVVGAPGSGDGPGGVVHVYDRNLGGPDNWGLFQRIRVDGLMTNDWFGWTVALRDNTLAVVKFPGNNQRSSGTVHVFERADGGAGTWVYQRSLTSGTGEDRYGGGVALGDGIVVVGAANDAGAGEGAGKGYVYGRDTGGANNWGCVTSLMGGDTTTGDQFGWHVAIDADTAAIGAPGDDSEAGAVYMFERNVGGPDNWGQACKLRGYRVFSGDEFGVRVALHGDTLAVASRKDDRIAQNAGAVYLFQRDPVNPHQWYELTNLTASDAEAGDQFGLELQLRDDILAVSALGNPYVPAEFRPGPVYIFQRDVGGANHWGEVMKINPSLPVTEAAGFGFNLALDGTVLAVAEPETYGQPEDMGEVFLFHLLHIPVLGQQRSGDDLLIDWTPASAPGYDFVLEQATNLTTPTWSPVPTGGTNCAVVPCSESAAYYRLRVVPD